MLDVTLHIPVMVIPKSAINVVMISIKKNVLIITKSIMNKKKLESIIDEYKY